MQELEVKSLEPAHTDDRGEIIDLLDGEEIKHLGLITCHEGAIRGNHYHEKQSQWMVILEGEINLYLKDLRQEENEDIKQVKMIERDMIYIPPRVIHTIEAIDYTEFLDVNDKVRGDGELYEEDTIRVEIV